MVASLGPPPTTPSPESLMDPTDQDPSDRSRTRVRGSGSGRDEDPAGLDLGGLGLAGRPGGLVLADSLGGLDLAGRPGWSAACLGTEVAQADPHRQEAVRHCHPLLPGPESGEPE